MMSEKAPAEEPLQNLQSTRVQRATDASKIKNRKVLLVSYYFPPSGGSGVQRVLKMAKYLPRFGWQPTVLTVRPEDAAFPALDPTLLADVPPGVRVERTRAWDPYALYARLLGKKKSDTVRIGFADDDVPGWKEKAARWLRANLFLPDARAGWAPFAARRGAQLVREGGLDAVWTTGPPHSAHLAGRWIARRTGRPHVADFRDPWTDISYYEELPVSAPARWLDAALERAVLRRASAITTVNPSLQQLLEQKTTAGAPLMLIRNGFDSDDFPRPSAPPERAPSDDAFFTLVHVGNLTASQNPEALWTALARLRRVGTVPRLRLRTVGRLDAAAQQDLDRQGLTDWLSAAPYMPHAEAVAAMERATLLLLCINRVPGAEGITTGKVYEYLASGRPVLGVGPPAGDAAAVLQGAGAGRMFDYDDAESIARFVQMHYDAWAAGTPRAGAAPEAAATHSRRAQAGQLAALLEALTL